MASQSQLSICNLSLLSIGVQQQISSLNEGSPQANACVTLFTFCYEQLARMAKWGCLNKQSVLTLIQAAQGTPENSDGTVLPIPQQPWQYAYLYPSDCLQVRQLWPLATTAAGSGVPQFSVNNSVVPGIWGEQTIPYIIGYSVDSNDAPLEVILTNQETAVANYTVNQPAPSTWDSLFTAAYVAYLALYLVPALSLDKGLMSLQMQLFEKWLKQAQAMDGNEEQISQDHIPDFIRARSGSRGYFGLSGYSGFGLIPWPV